MSSVEVVPLVGEGLGNSAYLVELGGGRALAVDVSIDLRAVSEVVERRGLKVASAADTHLHADSMVEFPDGVISDPITFDLRSAASR